MDNGGRISELRTRKGCIFRESYPRWEKMTEVSERITVDPNQCGGRPCIRGMRIRVVDVLDLLASGLTAQEVIAELPDLEVADIEAALRFASRRLNHPILAA
jgi:uncharacterized protein (DUF433 family)